MGNQKSPTASPSTILRAKLTVAKADQAAKKKKSAAKAASKRSSKENKDLQKAPTSKRAVTVA
jgi:hypothetical protein